MLEGIDVSNNNGEIDWSRVYSIGSPSGKDFAFIKSSEGPDRNGDWFTDSYFFDNITSARRFNLEVGAYHFCRPSGATGAQEANYALDAIGEFRVGEFFAFDLEDARIDPNADLLAYALNFKRTFQSQAGFLPVLYSNQDYMQRHNLTGNTSEHQELAQCGLWIASWGLDSPPTPPAPWDSLAFWQYSATGSVPGVRGDCDLDRFFGDREQLRKYGKLEVEETPATTLTLALAHIREARELLNLAEDLILKGGGGT
jgi:lysozyme